MQPNFPALFDNTQHAIFESYLRVGERQLTIRINRAWNEAVNVFSDKGWTFHSLVSDIFTLRESPGRRASHLAPESKTSQYSRITLARPLSLDAGQKVGIISFTQSEGLLKFYLERVPSGQFPVKSPEPPPASPEPPNEIHDFRDNLEKAVKTINDLKDFQGDDMKIEVIPETGRLRISIVTNIGG